MKIQCKDCTLDSSFCWTDSFQQDQRLHLHNKIIISILIGENIPKLIESWWMFSAEPKLNYWSILVFNSGHQSQAGLRAGRYMTAVFTHIWFSKWISLSLHYWSQSQYNECLPWRWHRGGLILPHSPKWIYLKYSTFCFRDPDCRISACVRACMQTRMCVCVCSRGSNQINHSRSGRSWSRGLMKVRSL